MALKYRPKYWHTDDKRELWSNWDEVVKSNGINNAKSQARRLSRLRQDHKDTFHANARDAFTLCDYLLGLLKYKDPKGKRIATRSIQLDANLKKLIKRYDLSSEEFFEVEDEIEMEQDCINCDDEEPFLDVNNTEKILNNWKGTMHKAKYNPRLSDKELQNIIRKTFKSTYTQKIEMTDDPITGARDRRKRKND